MNRPIIREIPSANQADRLGVHSMAQTPRQTRRAVSQALGALNTYEYLRRDDDPAWADLTARQQSRFIAAFQIGASSVDLRRALGRG
jgi:hypothetical protein